MTEQLVPADSSGNPPSSPHALAPQQAYAPFPMMEEEEAGGVDLRRYLDAVLRYKWAILLLVLLGTAGGVMAGRRVSPEYVAQATVWIEQSQRGDQDTGPIRSAELLHSAAWVDLMRSFVVLDHVVREQRLYLEYRPQEAGVFADFILAERFRPGDYRLKLSEDGASYELTAGRGMVVEVGAPGDSIGQEVGFLWQPDVAVLRAHDDVEFTVRTPRDASLLLGDQLDTRLPEQNGNFLRIVLQGTDPERLASTLNTLTDRYVDVAEQLKRGKLDELTAILDEQLEYAEESLTQAERELEAFRVQTITLPSESSSPVVPGLEATRDPAFSSFFDLRIEREQLRRDREAIEGALAAQASGGTTPVERLWAIASVQESAELRQALTDLTEKQAELRSLQVLYTDEHTDVQRLTGEIATLARVTVPQQARALVSQLTQRERSIEALIASASGDLREIPPRMIEEARLRRRMEIAERLYTDLQSRYESARLAAVSAIADVRVLDEATVPHTPTNPNAKNMAIVMGFMVGLGLGVGGAIVRARFDRRVRYPEQVTNEMGLPILGAVPYAAAGGGAEKNMMDAVLESFRELRLGLMHAYGSAGPVMLTVTSPDSGDGKSFVSSNLALAFADLGYPTLLIDGDIRRATLHNVLELSRKPGLTDYLAGAIDATDLIQRTTYEHVDFIGAGAWRRSGPELLASVQMRQLIAEMRSRYRVIIVDSSPLGAGVDPFVLGTMTGNILMVLRTGASDKAMASAKLDVLQRLPIRILGAVLNAVPVGGAYKYYAYTSPYRVIDGETEEEAREVVAGV